MTRNHNFRALAKELEKTVPKGSTVLFLAAWFVEFDGEGIITPEAAFTIPSDFDTPELLDTRIAAVDAISKLAGKIIVNQARQLMEGK